MHFPRSIVWTAGAATVLALAGCGTTQPAASSTSSGAPSAAARALSARTLLTGKGHGWTNPDDLAVAGGNYYVGFQNDVDSQGGKPGQARSRRDSTLVEFTLKGRIVHSWPITGKIDGIGADSTGSGVDLTVNEDGNSSLYAVTPGSAPKHYTYDKQPLPNGGGTDSVIAHGSTLYITASAPTKKTGPAVYEVSLHGHVAHVSPKSPIQIDSKAKLAATGKGRTTTLAVTDPDSSTMVPGSAPRFGGDFMLDAQGDKQAIFTPLARPGTAPDVLELSQAVDDTAFPTSSSGTLLAADQSADTVDAITGGIAAGTAYTVATPGDANSAPANAPANYLATMNLNNGAITPLKVAGTKLTPHSLLYVPKR